jgi:hypothetical protein
VDDLRRLTGELRLDVLTTIAACSMAYDAILGSGRSATSPLA